MSNSIHDWFDVVVDAYATWTASILNPRRVAQAILTLPDRRARIRAVTELWFSSTILSLVVSLPIYYGFGLKVENISFQLSALVFQYSVLILFAWLLHAGFKIYSIPSRLTDTFIIYTVAVSSVAPLISLLSLPAMRRTLVIIRDAKIRHLTAVPAAKMLAHVFTTPTYGLSAVAAGIVEPVALAGGFMAVAVFAQLAAWRYEAEVKRVIMATSFTTMLLTPVPLCLAMVATFAIMFAFVAGA